MVNETITPLTMTIIQFMYNLRPGWLSNFSHACSDLDFATQSNMWPHCFSWSLSKFLWVFPFALALWTILSIFLWSLLGTVSPQHSTIFFSISFIPALQLSISDGYGAINQPGWLDTRKINFSKDQPKQLHIQSNKPELRPFTAVNWSQPPKRKKMEHK